MRADPRLGDAGLGDPRFTDPRFAGSRPVACVSCGACVQVVKFSAAHTSVQWSLPAMLACLEFDTLREAGRTAALSEGCGRLRASIDAAVTDGRITVSAP
ncbi:MAG TPA: hypothetical protein VKU39_14250 [Streptosporangiaceae bacterium]|nr:hypothetical protein [Streptosporangiaceae bacterium]